MIVNTLITLFFLFGVFYTFKYKFVQFRFLKESRKVLARNKSAYLTFLMTLANHIGAGNIVGVTTALIYGGPGSLIWMMIACFFMSVFSLMENTLAIKYRTVINGEYRGGAAYYIKNGLKATKLAIFFSGILVLTNTIFFGSLQVNTLSESLKIPFNLNNTVIIVVLVAFAFLVIFKGTKRILRFIESVVPFMVLVFALISVIVIGYNFKLLPNIIEVIFKSAFNFTSIKGALIGGAFIIGLKRSAFSNEAGFGTAPSIAAMSEVNNPVSQGFVQVLCVFVDTAVMCTLMGVMILVYNIDLQAFEGASLAIHIFEVIFGEYGLYLGAFFLFSFSIATWVSSYYAGESNMLYLRNHMKVSHKTLLLSYRGLYLLGTFLGVFFTVETLWDFVDYGLILLGIVNLYAMIRLENVFKKELFKYLFE